MPSVMGAKGHGEKRGRINHFAVRTPPPIHWGEDDSETGGGGGGGRRRYVRDGTDSFEGPDASLPSADAQGSRQGLTSGWSLPHELDPTSSVTGGSSGGGANNWSIRTASRVSTCDTINSPSRVAAIMLGVTGVHTALPPPHINTSDGGDSSTSGGFSSLETASPSSPPDVDADGPSAADSHRRPQPTLPGTGGGAPEDTSWVGNVFQHNPGVVGGGGSGVAALEADFSSIDGGCVFPSTAGDGGRGGVTEGSGTARPLLQRAPGSGVRDEPPPSLVVVPADGGNHSGGHGGAAAAPLSNGSTVGRWRSDDDGGCSTVSSTAGGWDGGNRAKDGSAETSSAGKNNQEPSPTGFALVGRRPDDPDGRGAFAAETGEAPPRGGACRKECDTPATWGSDDLAGLAGIVSGGSDPPPTRSKSALRGWSVERTVPACSPLVTQKRGDNQSKTER